MSGRWSRRLDPTYPYRVERSGGTDAWPSAAIAFYSAAWQMLVLSLVVLLVVRGLTSAEPMAWWLFLPSITCAVAGAWCALSHHLRDNAFRWFGPWTVLAPAGPGLVYAFGPRRSGLPQRSS
jgi:hypothetical protein